MLPSRYFIELTQPEIAAQMKKNPLVILPQGSVEQHGPHLPAGTDIFAANAIAHAVAEKMDGLVLPGGPLGVTPLHMPFESTLTLTPDTYIRVMIETASSAAQHGAKYLLILNWHELNIPSIGIAADALHREHGLTVLTVQACFVAEEMFGKDCLVWVFEQPFGSYFFGLVPQVLLQYNAFAFGQLLDELACGFRIVLDDEDAAVASGHDKLRATIATRLSRSGAERNCPVAIATMVRYGGANTNYPRTH